mgnify:FL=1
MDSKNLKCEIDTPAPLLEPEENGNIGVAEETELEQRIAALKKILGAISCESVSEAHSYDTIDTMEINEYGEVVLG